MRIRLLVMAGGLLLSACTGPPTANSGLTYNVHSYGCCVENSGNITWHAGQHVTLHWQPTTAGSTTNANPVQIVLAVTLTGPFATVDALKQAISQGSKPAGVRTISAAPLTVTDRDVVTPASKLDLPADLSPGYYDLATKTAVGSLSESGDAVVIVVP